MNLCGFLRFFMVPLWFKVVRMDADKVKAFTIRVSTDLYEKVSNLATEQGFSVTQVARTALNEFVQNGSNANTNGSNMNQSGSDVNANGSSMNQNGSIDVNVDFLHSQLKSKDEQISELHRLLALQQQHHVLLTQKEGMFGRLRNFFVGSKIIGSNT